MQSSWNKTTDRLSNVLYRSEFHFYRFSTPKHKEVVSFLENYMKTDAESSELQSRPGIHLRKSMWLNRTNECTAIYSLLVADTHYIVHIILLKLEPIIIIVIKSSAIVVIQDILFHRRPKAIIWRWAEDSKDSACWTFGQTWIKPWCRHRRRSGDHKEDGSGILTQHRSKQHIKNSK